MEIVFIRHAQKEKEVIDPPLTKKGIKQIRYLIKRFKKEKFNGIYCSDMKRAIQTAILLGRKISLKPRIESSLREFDVEILKKDRKDWDDSLKNKYDKLEYFLKDLTKNPNANTRILIVAHGNTNRLIMAILLELGLQNLVRFGQLETAVNEIYWFEKFKNWRLRYWNDTRHLNKELLGENVY